MAIDIPDIIKNKWPNLTFVKVTEVKIDKPMYTIDYLEGKPSGFRLIYSTGFIQKLEGLS